MEKLEKMVPLNLRKEIEESKNDLTNTCYSLLQFFINKPLFHHIVGDLTDLEMALCRKNKEAALELKNVGNEHYSREDYSSALDVYSKALRVAPVEADDRGKNLLAVLYVNRASALHKKGLLVECIRDCNRALLLSPTYAKAWYRRGKANVSLENHEDATRDLDIAMHLELSSSGRRQIMDERNLISVEQKIKCSSAYKPNERSLEHPQQMKLQCVSTPTKGRGMASLDDIRQASLVHSEEPYAAEFYVSLLIGFEWAIMAVFYARKIITFDLSLERLLVSFDTANDRPLLKCPYFACCLQIILKPCRETHCHFCLNELPVDTVPCLSCSIPLYCSQQCQELAGGTITRKNKINSDILKTLSNDIRMYIRDITSPKQVVSDVQHFCEHKYECGGVHWPAVLPTEIVLAGRILMKTVEQQKHCSSGSCLSRVMDLSHNYEKLLPGKKLELHISSIILLYCLPHSYRLDFPKTGETISKFVILLSQIKVNSMAIVRMKFRDPCGQMNLSGKYSQAGEALTSSVEQVKVGQAIYSAGSLFNHSCQPNIHAYFMSRTLFVRATEYVGAGCPLELSYGPQLGEWDCKKRLEILEDRYSFRCACRGCSEINVPDLLLNAFHCTKPNCLGVVLDCCETEYEKQKIIPPSCALQQQGTEEYGEICEVAGQVLQQSSGSHLIEPGKCLNCGSYRDLEAAHLIASKADISVKCLQHQIGYYAVQMETLSEALVSLDQLKLTLHAFSKRMAEVEDHLAHAFCLVGKLQLAVKHCKASLQILEKLYGHDHIAIGNELLKLSSIQLELGDQRALDTVNHVTEIFSRYYGNHANLIFPFLEGLRKEAHKHARRKGKFSE